MQTALNEQELFERIQKSGSHTPEYKLNTALPSTITQTEPACNKAQELINSQSAGAESAAPAGLFWAALLMVFPTLL